MAGISDQCTSKGVNQFTEQLLQFSGAEGFCIEVGNGAWDSWFLPLEQQTEIVCNKVVSFLDHCPQIAGLAFQNFLTFNMLGNLIGRGILEFCDGGPPVKNFVSLAGPHAGTASVPLCGSSVFCIIADTLIKSEIYSDFIQAIPDYLEHCKFLPKLNNEIPEKRNSTYKERFSSLQNLVLIMFEHDTVLIPKETSWFGYYPDGAYNPILPPQQTKLYIEDWIGLKALDEAGRVKYIAVPGNHLGISKSDMKKHVVPYLVDSTENGKINGGDVGVYGAHQRDSEHGKRQKVVPEVEEKLSSSVVLEGSSSYDCPQQSRVSSVNYLGLRGI
ncbi:Palmitoyl-protein thioesterase 1 [Morus notabilis]|uniref:Palmitoyl-protein thioesterase 1 n=1 Tax=Morus notabilis TaxID=981085 RepID=W9RPZ1_9ROSA|nr:Palmitoyl-protein thioesterase 1 [Morus notabilis]